MKRPTPDEAPKGITTADDLVKALKQDPKLADGAGLRRANATDDAVQTIPTGIDTLDGVTGRGGVPRSRMIVFSGKEGGGKTTAALCAVAAFQKRGGLALYIDAERKLDFDWAAKNGVKVDDLIVSHPIHLERAFMTAEDAVKKTDPAVPLLIVLDSVNAGLTKDQMESGYEDQPAYGPQSRVFSAAIPKLIPHLERSGATFLLISQIREKMNAGTTIAGGNAVRFYSVLIVVFEQFGKVTASGKKMSELRKLYAGRVIPDSEGSIIGADFSIKTVKNQLAPPFRDSVMRISFVRGVDRVWCTLRRAEEMALVERSGAWYSFGAERIGQGADGCCVALRKNKELLAAIRKAVRAS